MLEGCLIVFALVVIALIYLLKQVPGSVWLALASIAAILTFLGYLGARAEERAQEALVAADRERRDREARAEKERLDREARAQKERERTAQAAARAKALEESRLRAQRTQEAEVARRRAVEAKRQARLERLQYLGENLEDCGLEALREVIEHHPNPLIREQARSMRSAKEALERAREDELHRRLNPPRDPDWWREQA